MRTSQRMRSQQGFTLIELMIVIILISCITGAVAVCSGNMWFFKADVQQELKALHPELERISGTHRNVFADSVIKVENKDGSRSTYCLDSNVLFNHSLELCEDDSWDRPADEKIPGDHVDPPTDAEVPVTRNPRRPPSL
jgi:prepilin-type N-terminal cleavage/methylation domain-containing protein